jgi:hypothetical protein
VPQTKTIGVSNYCPSTFECLLEKATVVPAVNQVQYHIGMGTDPIGLISYCKSKNITLQAYSPLGDGKGELITGELVTGIGKNHGKSGAQVSLRWVAQHGVPLSTKASNAKCAPRRASPQRIEPPCATPHANCPSGRPRRPGRGPRHLRLEAQRRRDGNRQAVVRLQRRRRTGVIELRATAEPLYFVLITTKGSSTLRVFLYASER